MSDDVVNVACQSGVKPRLRFVGPMIGRHPGQVTTQGEIVAQLFAAAGYPVTSVSGYLNRYARLFDIITTLWHRGHTFDILLLQMFGGPSFVVGDIASRIGRRYAIPTVMVLHGGSIPDFMARFPRWTRRAEPCRPAGRAVALPARAVAPFGLPLWTIPNVIDLADYPQRHRQAVGPRLFWMRTFHPIYNPMMALRVVARLGRSCPKRPWSWPVRTRGWRAKLAPPRAGWGWMLAVRFAGFLNPQAKASRGGCLRHFSEHQPGG